MEQQTSNNEQWCFLFCLSSPATSMFVPPNELKSIVVKKILIVGWVEFVDQEAGSTNNKRQLS